MPINGLYITALLALLALSACGGGSANRDKDTGGLDSRPLNTTCIAPDSPNTTTTYTINQVFDSLQFNAPIAMLQAPNDSSRWFIVEQAGVIRVFDNRPDVQNSLVFLDIANQVTSGGERGLLGMAFHPDFSNNRQVYVSYTTTINNQLRSRISRLTSNDNGQTLDSNSEEVLLAVDQPFSNHNGGHIAFGPDNFLYIGLGDGGSAGDPQGHGQNTSTLLGAMLRIDVDNGTPYAIPAGNPFINDPASRSEIYAWGLRNPWRWSFDQSNGALWLGDVGQGEWEEINRIALGSNYGWNTREGAHCYNDPTDSCSTAGLTDPVHEYDHDSGGRSVTGGYVYRGSNLPALQGAYIFGDFTNGKIWYLADPNSANPEVRLLQDTNINISSFAQDHNGEVYAVNYGGELYQISAQSTNPSNRIPDLLSQTGCVDTNNPNLAANGLIPYEVNAPFWSDGADKQRWIALPENATIDINNMQDWQFPPGTVLMKHFRLNNRLIETRLMMHHRQSGWNGYSYEWNDQQTDASLVTRGKLSPIGNQDWYFPASADCLQCHTQAAGFSLGLETAQFNRDNTYPSTGRTANQLTTLDAIGMFSNPLANIPDSLPQLPAPFATAAPALRARAWLHSNCAQCHRSNGPTPVNLDLDYDTPIEQTGMCDELPQSGDLGLTDARIVSPGNPSSSVLLARINTRDTNAMPPLGSVVIDTNAVQLIQEWIRSMPSTCE